MQKTRLSFFLLLLTLSNISFAQNTTQRKVNQLDYNVEEHLNAAAKHMILFILTQNENEYHESMKRIQVADTLQKSLNCECKNLKGLAKKIQEYISEDRVDEFLSYKNETLKTFILSEEMNNRNIKIRFRGKTYKLSKESKMLYENFIAYFPQN